MSQLDAVVWLDHREAKVVDFSADEVHRTAVRHEGMPRQVHHRAGTRDSPGHPQDTAGFFDAVADAVGAATRVLIVGPGQAKTEFKRHVDRHRRELAQKVVGVETMDHPSDGELLSYAKRYFGQPDRIVGLPGSS